MRSEQRSPADALRALMSAKIRQQEDAGAGRATRSAKREGHFVFKSGHHGQIWLDLERPFLHPERVQPLAEALAHPLRGHRVAAVCGPLVEGAFVSLLVAWSLRLTFTYSEPVPDHRATGLFPVSHPIPKTPGPEFRGKRLAIVDDVINAGSAVRGTLLTTDMSCGARSDGIDPARDGGPPVLRAGTQASGLPPEPLEDRITGFRL